MPKPTADVWAGRPVLVTGHTGFKGSWLSSWLTRLGSVVTGFSDGVPTEPSLYELTGLAERITSLRGDVADPVALATAVEEARPSVIFHLAAQPLVRASYDNPVETFRTNVLGTVQVLEAARRATHPIDAVVIVTTDKCYENRAWEYGYREDDRLGGRDPYSASKAAAELVTRSYRDALLTPAGGPPVVTVRAGNVIGGGDWAADRLLPDIVRAAAAPRPRLVLRNPSAQRPWQHVLDCLAGYLLLTERLLTDPDLAGPWNFGPDVAQAASVAEVVERFVDGLGRQIEVSVESDHQRHEELLLSLDATRARRRLGWDTRFDLEAAIATTAAWYAAYLDGRDVRELTERQIIAYEERLPRPA